jgi:hypothetical protein
VPGDHKSGKRGTKGKVAIELIQWISNRVRRQQLCIVWDDCFAHRDEDLRREPGGLHIAVEYRSAGVTDEWQPLDSRIFESLKGWARAIFDDQWAKPDVVEFPTEMAIVLPLKTWIDNPRDSERLG